MTTRLEAVVESARPERRPDSDDPERGSRGRPRRSLATAGSWALWMVSVTTVLGWVALAALPASSRTEVFPWWFRISGWVQVVTLVTVGRLIVSRYPRHVVGWCFSAAGVFLALWSGTRELFTLKSVPLLALVEWLVGTRWLWIPAMTMMTVVVPLTFPDGRPLSRRWRPVIGAALTWVSCLTLARALRPGPLLDVPDRHNALGIGGGTVRAVADHGLVLWPVFLVISLVALVARFITLPAQERDASRWLILAMAVMIACLTADKVLAALTGQEPPLLFYLSSGASVLVPLVAALAILKFRLYGIDVVIQRAFVYGALAVFVSGVYVVVVGGLGTALSHSGRPYRLLPLIATTLIAIAFQTVRERLQRLANRLVYGRRATPYEVLSHFVDGMSGSIPDDVFIDRMARVVAEGVGASEVQVWLRNDERFRHAASYPHPGPPLVAFRGGSDHLPVPGPDDRMVEMRFGSEPLGALLVRKRPGDPVRALEAKLLDDVARQAALVLANGRLATELSAKLAELEASRARIVAATDAERRRLERDLHDGAQQRLVNVSLLLSLAGNREVSGEPDELGALVREANAELAEALAELRELARGIHPAILAEAGLGPAVRSLAERCKTPAVVAGLPLRRLPQSVEVAAYFVVSEALTNVVKHARASSVEVCLTDSGDELLVCVADDGVGGADLAAGSGLRGLVDRVGALNGSLTVQSHADCGTSVEARLPCA